MSMQFCQICILYAYMCCVNQSYRCECNINACMHYYLLVKAAQEDGSRHHCHREAKAYWNKTHAHNSSN